MRRLALLIVTLCLSSLPVAAQTPGEASASAAAEREAEVIVLPRSSAGQSDVVTSSTASSTAGTGGAANSTAGTSGVPPASSSAAQAQAGTSSTAETKSSAADSGAITSSTAASAVSQSGEQGGGRVSSRPRSSTSSAAPKSVASVNSAPHSDIPARSSLSTATTSARPAVTVQSSRSSQEGEQSSSSLSSSSHSAESSPVIVIELDADGAWYNRESFGYTEPIIDPDAIVRPSEFSLDPHAIAGNGILALLFALVVALSGVVLSRLLVSDEARVKQILGRLPFQLALTLLLFWLLDAFIPDVSAQGFAGATSVSLLKIPLFAFIFFLVVGGSNFLFNNILTTEGDRFNTFVLSRFSGKSWFILVLVLVYGVIGAYINPEFRIPEEQLGMAIIVILSIVLSACMKDVVLFLLARFWRLPSWFKANVSGLVVAAVCVIISRSFQLSPGYIYGIPVGVVIASTVYSKRESFFEFLGILWLLVLALIVWVLGSFLTNYPVPLDILNLLFVIMIEDAFLELLPLPYLAGGAIFRWRKLLWFLEFTLAAFLLFHTLFNPEGTIVNLEQSPPALSAVLLLGCYAAGVFLLWAYIVWGRKRATDTD